MQGSINIIIADDSRLIRDGLTSLLDRNKNISILSSAENGQELLKLLEFSHPDIILLDLKMPVMDGESALKIISKKYPEIKVIMISMYFEEALMEDFKNKGAWGFIPKGCDDNMIAETISAVYKGTKLFNTEAACDLAAKQKNNKKFDNKDRLSTRELEIVNLICLCKSNKQIANTLFVTERTIEFHKTNIYKKTKCVSPSDLVLYAIKNGLMIL